MQFYLILTLLDELISSFEFDANHADEKTDILVSVRNLIELSEYDPDIDTDEKLVDISSYDIIFDANCATFSGTTTSALAYHGKRKVLRKNGYKRIGYDFLGWSTNKMATTAEYNNLGSILVEDKTVTQVVLYAVWKIKQFTISFNANGGSGIMNSIKRNYGTEYGPLACAFKRTNYSFVGWSKDKLSTTAQYTATSKIIITEDLTLYAIWKEDTCKITFSSNGGTGTMAVLTIKLNTKTALTANAFKRTGYKFKGWATSAKGSVAYIDKAQITVSSSIPITLYAIWEEDLVVNPLPTAKAWNACTKASCWYGDNAKYRVMNILSPHMSDSTFNSRYSWSKGRGVNCFHLFVSNNHDGEYSGYSIYGNQASGSINTSYTNVMGQRIRRIFNDGFGVILWLMADDDHGWNNTHLSHYEQYIKDLKSLGWFQYASTICLGLEINESVGSAGNIKSMAATLKKYYGGKIGVHFGSRDQYSRAHNSGVNIIFGQITPKDASDSRIKSDIDLGKKYASAFNMFELSRTDDRRKAEYALAHGAYGVGNW